MTGRQCVCNHVLVRVLRDQPATCACCGELVLAGEEVLMPPADAARLAALGDVEILPRPLDGRIGMESQ